MDQFVKRAFVLFLLALPFIFFVLPSGSAASFTSYNSGPYVDRVLYDEIHSADQQVLAIQGNEIDMIGGTIEPVYLDILEADPHIEISRTPRNGYGHLTINCDKYPYNLTSFRRALAFALDKEEIATSVWAGEAIPQDSVVPAINPWSYESYLTETYYAAQPSVGNQLLDAAGFADIDADGFREAPDGSDFEVVVEVPVTSQMLIDCGVITGDALDSLGIDCTILPTDSYEIISRVYFHGDFDIVAYGASFSSFDLTFLESQYGSDYYMIDYYNPANFQNATFDGWIPQLLYGAAYEDILEAAHEMQKILWYEQPRIVLYNNYNLGAYRTDVFEGHVESAIDGVAGPWTNLKVHKKTGTPWGGTFRISLSGTPETYNHMVASSAYSAQVLSNMENSLMMPGPDGSLAPWLAESYTVETHDDNAAVPEGHMRFTFGLVPNATWSDGTPLTANDVAFTLNYYRDGIAYGNPTNPKLTDMNAAYSISPYGLVVEMATISYWHINTIACNTILPQHIFQVIGVENWNTWNPVYSSDPYVTSGPFFPNAVDSGNSHELVYNPGFFFSTRAGAIHDELEFAEGSTGNSIGYETSSETPLQYEVYRDGSLLDTESWDGSAIEYDVDGLAFGAYNYTILAYYAADGYYSFTVWVTVYDGTPPTIEDSSDLTLSEGQAESVVVWNPYDLHPVSYVIMVNESVVQIGLWNSTAEAISFSMSSYEVGVYNVTLMVVDIGLHIAYDSLLVTIVPYVPTTTTTTTTTTSTTTNGHIPPMDPLLLAIAGGAVAVGILIVVVVMIRRRP